MDEPDPPQSRLINFPVCSIKHPKGGPLTSSQVDRDSSMLMDLDLDSSWSFEQIFSSSAAPTASEQLPYSPLWAFSDDANGDTVTGNGSSCAVEFRLADFSRKLNCDTNLITENPTENDEDRKPSVPTLELAPLDCPDVSFIIKERMTQALRFFKDSTEHHVLAQVWAPVKTGGRYVLTTSGQPFVLDPKSKGLYQYRMASLMYMFSTDGETDDVLGLPGRVFRQKLPEWSPDVQYYSSKEFSRLNHALHYNVRGTLALPVFDPSVQTCVGVLELIMTCQKINYAPEVDKVCKALEAVNLKSSEILDHPNIQICNEGRQNALADILEILTVVCENHKLPLAQTWVPCRHRSVLANGGGFRKSCSSFDGSCMGQICMSTTDVAFYVVDAHQWGFREACAEHHLQKGQGVVGRAFAGRNSCFCEDVTQFCKTEYPLVHYARLFGLTSCFAICLQSTHTGDDDYVLEFFLPPNIKDHRDQMALLDSLLATMKSHLRSLRVASGHLEHELRSTEIVNILVNEKLDLKPEFPETPKPATTSPDTSGEIGQPNSIEELQPTHGVSSAHEAKTVVGAARVQKGSSVSENKDNGKKPQRKRGKAEKTISLDVLQQYFAGSLKDAAKSLGVCPTTMKRICRQHGISRWPSRKINKVNRSLTKLKRVIESVQVADGAFTLTSLASSSMPVTVGSMSWPASLNASDLSGLPGSGASEIPGDETELPQLNGFQHEENAKDLKQIHGMIGKNHDLAHQPGGNLNCEEGSHRSKSGSGSREVSTAGTPTSHGSCQSSPCMHNVSSSPLNEPVVSPSNEQNIKPVVTSVGFMSEPRVGGTNSLSAGFSMDAFMSVAEPQEPFGVMLIEDAGSSHDLQNLCSAGEAGLFDERMPPDYSWTNWPKISAIPPKDSMVVTAERMPELASMKPEAKTFLTIKATYGEDIIRFRLLGDSSVEKLREEIGKRLKLEPGTFEIKYLDDDQEWVRIACDADLQECVDVSKLSGCSLIRLMVNDIMPSFGSSCESSGECGVGGGLGCK
ncbi:OLC1v1028956C4 [Oldenlandia corymbosa var. corymbosa]|uniref:OLC1v1028956C4 n=1 Tax=Oldenlandia corymbosa var. corymbosa TaxID=529605 RepID=A0AAV1CG25_OLDCO|nr:OLC1v1028956C4 [Oldenlandia corymbosa var. corymbosa]